MRCYSVLPVALLFGCAGASKASRTPEVTPSRGVMIVDVRDDDAVGVDGTPVRSDGLAQLLATRRGDRLVAVRANAAAPWGKVVQVLGELVRSSAKSYELVVDTQPTRGTAPLAWPEALADGETRQVLAVDLSREGTVVSVDGHPVRDSNGTEAELRRRIVAIRSRPHADRPWVALRADRAAPFGHVVDATRTAQDAGAFVAFAVNRLARPAKVATPDWSECPFPAAADAAEIDSAVVVLRVTVDPSGRASKVTIESEPGYDFGEAARECAIRAAYEAAHDVDGRAIEGETRPFRVRFERPSPAE